MKQVIDVNSWDKLKNGEQFQPIRDKEGILSYLRDTAVPWHSSAYVIDEVSQETTNLASFGYSSDGFFWTTDDIYHFEKYNVPLKPEFLEYVLKHINLASK